jgi:hypothetical protein
MKRTIKLLALAATLAVVAIPVFAQTQECNDENKGTWYGTFFKNYKGDAAAQKVAYDAAKTYLGACPADPADKQAAFMKKFVDAMDALAGKAKVGNACDEAIKGKNYADEMKFCKELLTTDPDNVDVISILGVAGLAQGSLLNESATYAEKAIQLIEGGKPLKAYTHDQGLAYLNWTVGKSKLASAPADAIPYFLKSAKLESEVKKNPLLYLDLSAAYETGPRAKLSNDYTASLNPDKTETAQSKVILENLNRVIDNQIDAMARAAALAPADAKKTIVGDLSTLYKYRNKEATDANITELVANVLSKPIPDVPTPVTSAPATPTPGTTPAGTAGTSSNGTSTNNGGTKTGAGGGTTAPASSKRPRRN